MLSEEYIRNLIIKYKEEIKGLPKSCFCEEGGISHLDGIILYCIIREYNYKNIMEFSPNKGYSTSFLAKAAQKNGGHVHSFEKEKDCIESAKNRLKNNGLDSFVTFYEGDVLKKHKNGPSNYDMIFIDSNHTAPFAKLYINEVLPKTNGLIFVHDIGGNFVSNQFTVSSRGEAEVIKEYILRNKFEYLLTHELFGGFWENSPKLEINNRMDDIFKLCHVYEETKYPFSVCPMLCIINRNNNVCF